MIDFSGDAVLFDLDGTLVDSSASVLRAWQRVSGALGIPFAAFDPYVHGIPAPEVFAIVAPQLSAAEVRDLSEEMLAAQRLGFAPECCLVVEDAAGRCARGIGRTRRPDDIPASRHSDNRIGSVHSGHSDGRSARAGHGTTLSQMRPWHRGNVISDSPARPVGLSVDDDRHAIHGSFTLPFELSAPPARVFSAFAELPLRKRWFRLPGKAETVDHELDFRVGGGEIAGSTFAAAGVSERLEYRSQFLDIVPGERIVLAYEFALDGRRRWVSLVTIELSPAAGGTALTWTEQYAFLAVTGDGGQDIAHLQGGLRLHLNGLASVVEGPRP